MIFSLFACMPFIIIYFIYKNLFNSGIIILMIFELNLLGLFLDKSLQLAVSYYYLAAIYFFIFGIISKLFISKLKSIRGIYKITKKSLNNNTHKYVQITLFVTFILIIFGSLYYSVGIPIFSNDPDNVRFEQQNIPGFGLLYRLIYWSIPTVLLILLLINKEKKILSVKIIFPFIFIIALLLILLGGSKSAVLHFMLPFFLYWAYSVNKITIYGYIKFYISFIISFFIIIYMFMINSGTSNIQKAFSIFIYRITLGAAEGLKLILTDYVKYNGLGYGWYTFIKPLYTFAGSFRLINKSVLTMDTGNYIGIYYRGPDNLAPFTYTILGQGYLDFGYLGMFAIAFIFGYLLYSIYLKIKQLNNKNYKLFSYYILFDWLLISLASWGYIDGWIFFAVIYVVLPILMIKLFYLIIPSVKKLYKG